MKKIFTILLVLNLNFAQAQYLSPKPSEQLSVWENAKSKTLSFNFEATSFFKNNEYFNEFTKGYTSIGYFLKPTFEYYLSNNTKLNIGAHLLQYGGTNKFSEVAPVFSIQHKITNKLDLLLGSIYSTRNHKLAEPLFAYDHYYKDNIEYGIQFLWRSKNLESDLWIDWKRFIKKDDPFNEEFIVGNTTKAKFRLSDKLNLFVNLQLLVSHSGGQINNSNKPTTTIYNGLIGPIISQNINNSSTLSAEGIYAYYKGNFPCG